MLDPTWAATNSPQAAPAIASPMRSRICAAFLTRNCIVVPPQREDIKLGHYSALRKTLRTREAARADQTVLTVVMDHKYAFGPFQFPKPLPNAATRARWAASLSAPPIKRRADQTGRIHISLLLSKHNFSCETQPVQQGIPKIARNGHCMV